MKRIITILLAAVLCVGTMTTCVLAAASGNDLGIAAFDDEMNERFPTAWHIRNYGLFAANNLYFKGGFTIKAGESLTYRFRVVFHEDNSAVADRYILYANRER